MIKNGAVICPICGGEVIAFDSLYTEIDISKVFLSMVGKCDHCGNHYRWHESYTYEGYFNLEQTELEDEVGED